MIIEKDQSLDSTDSLALKILIGIEKKFWKVELYHTLDSILNCHQDIVRLLKTKNVKDYYIILNMEEGF